MDFDGQTLTGRPSFFFVSAVVDSTLRCCCSSPIRDTSPRRWVSCGSLNGARTSSVVVDSRCFVVGVDAENASVRRSDSFPAVGDGVCR